MATVRAWVTWALLTGDAVRYLMSYAVLRSTETYLASFGHLICVT